MCSKSWSRRIIGVQISSDNHIAVHLLILPRVIYDDSVQVVIFSSPLCFQKSFLNCCIEFLTKIS